MPRDLASKVRVFAAMVEHMLEYDEHLDVSAALVWRDSIHNDLKNDLKVGAPAPPDAERLLEEADARLLAMREELVDRFPEVFEDRAPREHWWWHLEKGPQVREDALAARLGRAVTARPRRADARRG